MKRGIGVLALGFTAFALLGGCAAQRAVDGVHLAALGSGEVFYQFYNAKPESGVESTPLVFVHGWACDHRHWAAQVEGLAHDRAMLVIDLPGYGQSSDGGSPHTMDLYAAGVASAMDDAGLERAVLIGHSMGTAVIRQFYRHHPARTAGLVAVDGALQMESPEEMEEAGAPLFTDQWQEYAVRMFDGMSSEMAHDADRALVREVLRGTTRDSVRGGFASMIDPEIWTDEPIGAPLLLTITEAPWWTDAYKEYVRTLAPGVRIEVFPGASHFLMMDQPEHFNRVLEAWLEQRGL